MNKKIEVISSSFLRYQDFRGSELFPYIESLAKLRMKIFHDWPYLYEGNMEYEKTYLKTYLESSHSFVCLVFHNQEMVGATTALLASDEEEAFQSAFLKQGHRPQEVCYFGESILMPQYRGMGVGKEFMQRRLQFARSLKGVRWASFCAVQRPSTHPLRPSDYRPLNNFWKQMGFRPIENMITEYSWPDIGEQFESKKIMQFWMQEL